LQLERVRAAQARGTRVEVWFADEARIGQKNSLTRVWGQTGSRPVAPKDLGFASAYLFGAVCPSAGKAAALIMPICNTAAMNHHLIEISSQVTTDAHAVVILDGASWHRSQGLVVPGNITLLQGTVKLAESRLGKSRVGRVKGRDEDASRPDLRRPSLPR
jgi:hypothetical protein